jgi:hypothetical protein
MSIEEELGCIANLGPSMMRRMGFSEAMLCESIGVEL